MNEKISLADIVAAAEAVAKARNTSLPKPVKKPADTRAESRLERER